MDAAGAIASLIGVAVALICREPEPVLHSGRVWIEWIVDQVKHDPVDGLMSIPGQRVQIIGTAGGENDYAILRPSKCCDQASGDCSESGRKRLNPMFLAEPDQGMVKRSEENKARERGTLFIVVFTVGITVVGLLAYYARPHHSRFDIEHDEQRDNEREREDRP